MVCESFRCRTVHHGWKTKYKSILRFRAVRDIICEDEDSKIIREDRGQIVVAVKLAAAGICRKDFSSSSPTRSAPAGFLAIFSCPALILTTHTFLSRCSFAYLLHISNVPIPFLRTPAAIPRISRVNAANILYNESSQSPHDSYSYTIPRQVIKKYEQ